MLDYIDWLQVSSHLQERLKAMAQFQEGKADTLVCTDVASRGIDIPSVRHPPISLS